MDYNNFWLQQYRKALFIAGYCQRGYGKTQALQQILKDTYTLYHNEQAKRISVKWVNPILYLKG